MYDFSSAEFWVVAAIGLAVGLLIGWLVTLLILRRRDGGKNAHQLRKEMDEYREGVNEHFARTAELFKDTTEKYRDLYEHLAGGAQNLCEDLPDHAQVDFRPGGLLTSSSESEEVGEVEEVVSTVAEAGDKLAEKSAS